MNQAQAYIVRACTWAHARAGASRDANHGGMPINKGLSGTWGWKSHGGTTVPPLSLRSNPLKIRAYRRNLRMLLTLSIYPYVCVYRWQNCRLPPLKGGYNSCISLLRSTLENLIVNQ